ncbi:hypothetical protein Nmel_007729 [Mimus melanotis]
MAALRNIHVMFRKFPPTETDPERPDMTSLLMFAMLCLNPEKKTHTAFSEFLQNQHFSLMKNFRYPFQMCRFSPKTVSGILTLDFFPHHLGLTMWNHLYSKSSTEP